MVRLQWTFAAFLLHISNGLCGELPAPPDELQYPNIVQPTDEYKAWGLAESELNDPYTCRHSKDGKLVISDFENHAVKIYDFDSRVMRRVQLDFQNEKSHVPLAPFATDIADDGSYFVVDRSSESLLEFSAAGKFVRNYSNSPATTLSEGGKLSIAGSRIAVADSGNNRVLIFERGSKSVTTLGHYGRGPGELAGPESVAFDRAGNLFVLDSYNNRVQVYDRSYHVVGSWGSWGSFKGFLANPSDIFISPQNVVYITDLLNHRVQAFSARGEFLFQFGRHPPTAHEGKGRIHYPTSVSVSPTDGSVVVCEPFESRLQRFSLVGVTHVANVNDSAWWEKGTKFHYGARPVAGITSSGEEFLAVSEPDTHAILFFKLDGRQTSLVEIAGGQGFNPGQFDRPSGIAIDGINNRLLISDAGNRRIQEFRIKSSGNQPSMRRSADESAKSAVLGAPTTTLSELGAESDNALSFVASHTVTLSPRNNLFKRSVPGGDASVMESEGKTDVPNPVNAAPISPSAIAIGPDGHRYVADPANNRIVVLDDKFNVLGSIGDGDDEHKLNYPLDVSLSKDAKSIFIVDHYNYRVMQFDLSGKFLRQIGGPGSTAGRFVLPFGIHSGQDGFVYVSDVGAQKVEKFDEQGNFVTQWGEWGTGPGQFYKPKGIAQLKDGTLVVLDFGNHRAQMFDQNGKFVRIFGIENAVVSTSSP